MNFTTKSRYAINALAELALLRDKGGSYALSDIAHNQGIEQRYLEQLFRKLRMAGILKSTRGRYGGYEFANCPSQISIKMVMEAVEENLDATGCSGASNCFQGKRCVSHNFWDNLNKTVDTFLEDTFITDLFESKTTKQINLLKIS
ncbi:MAG: Rrf2 family transcriptional regulator [Gammaproteobacteria bacterium]